MRALTRMWSVSVSARLYMIQLPTYLPVFTRRGVIKRRVCAIYVSLVNRVLTVIYVLTLTGLSLPPITYATMRLWSQQKTSSLTPSRPT
jgi:hypothetical protein